MNISNISVSACRGAFDRHADQVNLVDWIEHCRPAAFVRDSIQKKQLPAIMPHGYFLDRKAASIISHSGLVQIDIDAKDQDATFDLMDTLRAITDLDFIAVAGISCSGQGIWALAAVEGIDKDNHAALASQVCDWIEAEVGVVCDRVVSNNLASLRFASHDMPFINYDITPFA